MFITQPLGAQAPNDAAFIDLLKTLAIFLTGSLGGVLAGNGLKPKEKVKDPLPQAVSVIALCRCQALPFYSQYQTGTTVRATNDRCNVMAPDSLFSGVNVSGDLYDRLE